MALPDRYISDAEPDHSSYLPALFWLAESVAGNSTLKDLRYDRDALFKPLIKYGLQPRLYPLTIIAAAIGRMRFHGMAGTQPSTLTQNQRLFMRSTDMALRWVLTSPFVQHSLHSFFFAFHDA
ncbi:hypothetical protein [Parachitinimonas caeni]|uniref:Uncharacterized protein n=1 Tax=Parachitinimonas caeni TaxID=3031301 RepID=A0ABT7DZS8_9NEIS|nr:hypothetical protein [Parachitinimonas caeni]MDK2125566.1 hypothetical protein [Parachitinimonas caeni]